MRDQNKSYQRIPIADERGHSALVVELCEEHLRHFPDDRFVLIWYATAKIRFSQFAQAENALCKAIARSRGDGRVTQLACVEMGCLFREKGEFKKAAAWYRRALLADPKYGDGYNFLGQIAFKRGLLKQAELYYRKAIKRHAQSLDEAYFNLGGVLLARKRYQSAIECYRKAIKIDSNYSDAKKRLKDAKLALILMKSSPACKTS